MMKKKSWLLNIVGILIILLHISPLYITFMTSLKKKTDLSSKWFLPDKFSLDNYKNALAGNEFFQALFNTIIVTVGGIAIVVIVGAITGYVLARRKNMLTSLMLLATMGVMMVPGISLIVPLYNTMLTIGGINTFWGITLLVGTSHLPVSIFIYMNFIKSIPRELDEAAEMDGCGTLRTFFSIIMPQLGAVTASVLILNGVKIFNEFLYALYFLQSPDKKMITTFISGYFNENSNLNEASAAALLATLPVIIVYIMLQKYFVKGNIDGIGK
ncbi:raffinose/stachyose/melibiose transport system permease protein [Paenibacillus sp. DS2015]|uniref:carbohydrate ABC transporter permease n=1 Tax=Paenibacillus sp. DS2015 TaxID=3373917 RepID=UPI003D1FFB1F